MQIFSAGPSDTIDVNGVPISGPEFREMIRGHPLYILKPDEQPSAIDSTKPTAQIIRFLIGWHSTKEELKKNHNQNAS